ncbi:MAG: Mut7-C RNAse domain-containing protein [Spirochaetales bacterium]|nr:Mut7-C RNAse domain-containing protein [Spirochaetales bacterium]
MGKGDSKKEFVCLRFYEELNFFLPPEKRKTAYSRRLSPGQTVKDMIESEGVPHVEVDLILVNGESVGFDYRLLPGDRISVYPVFERLDISGVTRLQNRPLRQPRFVLDVHLHKLAVKMRLLGLDVDYQPRRDDPELAQISSETGRILLTRDKGLLMRKIVTHGLYIYETDPARQIREVVERLDLKSRLAPFSRCTLCNGLLRPIEPDTEDYERTRASVPPKVRKNCRRFSRCADCGKVYWEGSHTDSIRLWMDELLI